MLCKAELKEKVVVTALTVFRENGIKSITMDDIAAMLKISKRTLYEIFEDKEALLKECIIYHQYMAQEVWKEIVSDSTNVLEILLKCYRKSVEVLHKTDRRFFEDIKKYPEAYKLIMSYRKQDGDRIADFLRKGVAQGLFREEINYEIIQFLLREQFNALKNMDICRQYAPLEVFETIMLTCLQGISTQKGADELEKFVYAYRKKN
ncbi:HTH-type transcriptional repressor KstR2 [termite gut metagenome]|jgi:AcrR family transcriptional regulator|uniref:HTH-type transcriptional repressor KstR2 n=1 Tax=termite gut metagenome TaxID=433724 RepID=A0A5J4SJ73_9ZZZZ